MGDGTILSGAQIIYTYATEGEFDLQLSVFDQSGNTGIQVKRIYAEMMPLQIMMFHCDPTSEPMMASCRLDVLAREAPITTVTMGYGTDSFQMQRYGF